MSAHARRIAMAVALVSLLAVGGTAWAGHHEEGEAAAPAAWDQAKTTELAGELRKRASAAYDAVYRSQGTLGNVAAMQGNDFLQLKDGVRLAKTEARHLDKELQGGAGRDETYHVFMRLVEVVKDIREVGARMFLDQSILDKFGAANETLTALAPYYEPGILEKGPAPLAGPGAKTP